MIETNDTSIQIFPTFMINVPLISRWDAIKIIAWLDAQERNVYPMLQVLNVDLNDNNFEGKAVVNGTYDVRFEFRDKQFFIYWMNQSHPINGIDAKLVVTAFNRLYEVIKNYFFIADATCSMVTLIKNDFSVSIEPKSSVANIQT